MNEAECGLEDQDINHAPKRKTQNRDHDTEKGGYKTTTSISLCHGDYTVGWICALPIEMAAAKSMLEEIHSALPNSLHDHNTYTLGRIGVHNIVIACMPSGVYGTTSAGTVANQMISTFRSIRFGLMVGVGAGVPTRSIDIRLGDVVVSTPTERYGGVVQYDYGKTAPDGKIRHIGMLNKPPEVLLTAISQLRADYSLRPSWIPRFLSEMLLKNPDMSTDLSLRPQQEDHLFEAQYEHVQSESTCAQCDKSRLVVRPPRAGGNVPQVYYGLIASGNQVMKHGGTRDRLATELGVLCFEMEAAGLMDAFPCLVIRGICDYADSHKNKQWQPYAAGTAAAYAKELLSVISSGRVLTTATVTNEEMPQVQGRAQQREQQKEQQKERRRERLLASLAFDQIDLRQMTVKKAHTRTCDWLLTHSEYLRWLDANELHQHHGFLWIKGKPGAGKSTLMKFALAHTRETIEDGVVISFFFNARGAHMEKSTIGMYRSLLLRLLEQLPALQQLLDRCDLAPNTTGNYEWTIESLENLFDDAVRNLREASLICFIDALDECPEDQIREMMASFQRLGELATYTRTSFRVLFSSRHYPHITIRKGLSLDLEGQDGHDQDIANYIDSELRIGHNNLARQIGVEVQEKASGTFMWVVLVVRMINKAHDEGRTTRYLRKMLKDLPNDLHELFRGILTRDSRNKDELLLCLQWLLFACRPLEPTELYYGILSGTEPEQVSGWNSDEMSMDTVWKFILNSSKGLAEITKSEYPTVQFIHESVRDFLLKEEGLSGLWPDLTKNFRAASHERLQHCCLNYMSMYSAHSFTNGSSPMTLSRRTPDSRKSTSEMFPFLGYAVGNVLSHADMAQAGGIDQKMFLEKFPLSDWIMIHNSLKPFRDGYTSTASLLYLLAERNLVNLIRVHPSKLSCFETENEEYGLPFCAALCTGSEEALQTFFEAQAETQPATSPLHDMCKEYFRHEYQVTNFEYGFPFSWHKGPLSYLIEHNDGTLLYLFCSTGKFDINSRGRTNKTPLLWAAENGHEALVKLLLEQGADQECRGTDHRTPLLWAARKGHEALVKLLVEQGADRECKDRDHRTPLSLAAQYGHEVVLRLLLQQGANLESKDSMKGRTPLSMASMRGKVAVVKLLLEHNADQNYRDQEGRTPLSLAAAHGHVDVVQLLLEHGADSEIGDHKGRTPLSWAIYRRNEASAVLREKSADQDSGVWTAQTPFLWTSKSLKRLQRFERKCDQIVNVLTLGLSSELESQSQEG